MKRLSACLSATLFLTVYISAVGLGAPVPGIWNEVTLGLIGDFDGVSAVLDPDDDGANIGDELVARDDSSSSGSPPGYAHYWWIEGMIRHTLSIGDIVDQGDGTGTRSFHSIRKDGTFIACSDHLWGQADGTSDAASIIGSFEGETTYNWNDDTGEWDWSSFEGRVHYWGKFDDDPYWLDFTADFSYVGRGWSDYFGMMISYGSLTNVEMTIAPAPKCEGDFEPDGDVDGLDLATLAYDANQLELALFANEFGSTNCSLAPRISSAVCATIRWGDEEGLILLGQVVDASDIVVPNASVWVIGPSKQRVDFEYNEALEVYEPIDYRPSDFPIVTGEYTFYAQLGGVFATPITKSLSSAETMPSLALEDCVNANAGEPLTLEWNQVVGAGGYFVSVVDETTDQLVWSNISSFFDPLPAQTTVTIPGSAIEADKSYEVMIIACDSSRMEEASAISGCTMSFTPGEPFAMRVTLWASHVYPGTKFILLHAFLEDCFDQTIDGAEVWAIYPSGAQVPFVQNPNGWYQTTSPPDPMDPNSYGTYEVYAEHDGALVRKTAQLENHYLDLPTNIVLDPWPPERGQSLTVTLDDMDEAVTYFAFLNDPDMMILFHLTSSLPHFNISSATLWADVVAGREYCLIVGYWDASSDDEANGQAFQSFCFIAP